MVMYVVHSHPVQQKYKTHICSRATLFQFFVIFLTFIPPLIIAYVTQGKQFLNASVFQTCSFCVELSVLFINFAHLPRNITGFWLKESTYREQPDVRFKHEILLVVQGNTPGSFLAYSTFQNFNQLLQQKLRIPLIKVSSIKLNTFRLLEINIKTSAFSLNSAFLQSHGKLLFNYAGIYGLLTKYEVKMAGY